MQYGFVLSQGDVHSIPEMAQEAEEVGWDGAFIPDCIAIETPTVPPQPGYDPWIMLALMVARTQHIRLGTLLTPPSRRRPWKLARETITLDQASHGRLILPVGLGAAADDAGFYSVGEVMDTKGRAQLLDETLEILTGLWSGQPFHYDGKHYHIQNMTLLPAPVQSPRIPIWVVGVWPRMKSMQRVLRYDGLLPQKFDPEGTRESVTPEDLRAMKRSIDEQRTLATPFDIIIQGETPGNDQDRAHAIVSEWRDAGATWWIEAHWEATSIDEVRTRIRQGPPR
ncbi:MAG TPA: LLM class flavin-dependent oxidoreductase [Ktedonobacteraceae bacterium]|jgi:hypothetical protein